MKTVPRLAVLGSGKGSNFVALQQAILAGKFDAAIVLVVSDLIGAGILAHAQGFGLPTATLSPSPFRTKLSPEGEASLVDLLHEYAADWVILAGYMRVVKAPLLDAFPNRIINIHPSLLPAFKGLRAWEQALAAGAAETGCTVHFVNREVDGGEIIAQQRVPILPGDTPESLHARIQMAEHELYPAALAKVLARSPSPP
ncbi:MAG: phosphoribosylglycinamide formyltransferase [Methylacidiphilales bacterium]|nr:phosphoribosylglycinamide formyltransferase [Candidatus Methylacidiphilales bacterium]